MKSLSIFISPLTAGNDYEAIQNYDRALAIDPNNVAALENVTLSRLASLENVASEKYTSLEEFSFGKICCMLLQRMSLAIHLSLSEQSPSTSNELISV